MSIDVTDVPERQRYEAVRDGELLGFAAYERTPEMIVFTHTEVDPRFEGQGVGGHSSVMRSTRCALSA